jgi:putative transposase
VGVSVNMARRVAHNYREKGLERALREAPRPGQKPLIRPREEAQLIAMVCGPSPQGRARWTVSLVAEEANRRGITKAKKETIRLLMKRNALKPWREKNVVRPRVDE